MAIGIDISSVKGPYVFWITELIEKMGKPVIIYFEDTIVSAGAGTDDLLSEDDMRPDWDQTEKTIITHNTRTIKALTEIDSKDFRDYGLKLKNPDGILQLKTYLSDVPDLKRCKFVKPHANELNYIDSSYRLIREPVPIGLGDNNFAVSFWERM